MKQSQERVKLLSTSNQAIDSATKPLLPQIFASVAVGTFFLGLGFGAGFPVVFVPQLIEEQNCTNCSNVVPVTLEDTAWLVSVIRLMTPICAPVGGFMMDFFGRLNLLKIATIPTIIGWILLGAANSKTMLILGRLLTGVCAAWNVGVATYVAEISCPKVRGCLVAVTHSFAMLGMLIMLIEGSLLHWRIISWVCAIAAIVPVILIMFLPESSSWLVFKNRIIDARASLQWFNPENSIKNQEAIEQELQKLIERNISKTIPQDRSKKEQIKTYIKLFVQPTFYKPMIIMIGLCFLQQASGIPIICFYTVTFFKNMGTTINPYLATISLGIIRFVMSIVNIWLTRYYNRCTLLTVSSIGMSVSIGASAIYTRMLLQGTANYQWLLVVLLMVYVFFSMIGLATVPYIIFGEVFPLEIRGVAQNLTFTLASLIMFANIQFYYPLNNFFGPSGLQYVFSGISLLAAVYCYVLVPETHNKTLLEIEKHFLNNKLAVDKYVKVDVHTIYGGNSKTALVPQNSIQN